MPKGRSLACITAPTPLTRRREMAVHPKRDSRHAFSTTTGVGGIKTYPDFASKATRSLVRRSERSPSTRSSWTLQDSTSSTSRVRRTTSRMNAGRSNLRKASARSTSARSRRISKLAAMTACLFPSTTRFRVIRYGSVGVLSSLLYSCLFYFTAGASGKVLPIIELQVFLRLSLWGGVQFAEVLDHIQHHVLLLVGETQAPVEDRAYSLVSQRVYLLLPEQRRPLAGVQKVRGMNAERFRQGDHLAYGRVLERPDPDISDLFLGNLPEAHTRQVGVGVGLPRAFVLDNFEELVQPAGDVLLYVRALDPDCVPDLTGFLEPQLGREAHGLRYRPELVEAGVLDLPLAHHAHV